MTVEKSDQDKHFINSLTEQINEVMKSRKEMNDNSHLRETLRVLPVEAYRSAIGAIWNATVDDLRQKVLHQGIDHFNKKVNKSIKTYEDLQNLNDHTLLEGSCGVGIIDQEAHKVLIQAKETRNMFSGHPGSSEPTLKKVLSVAEDCIKYVLSRGYPSPTIDVDDYIETLKSSTYDRNEVAVKNMVDGLSEPSKKTLIHKLFKEYLSTDCQIFTGNIKFVLPFLWQKLSEFEKNNVVRQLDKILVQGDTLPRDKAFSFIQIVDGKSYLSSESSAIIKSHINPTIQALKNASQRNGYDEWMDWGEQVSDVLKLKPFSAVIVGEHTADYVSSLISVFVGTMAPPYKDTKWKDWVANGIEVPVLEMFRDFDDQMASIFIHVIKNDKILKDLVRNHPVKMKRLRDLAKIVDEKTSESFSGKELLKLLVDKTKEPEFLATLLDSRASDELE